MRAGTQRSTVDVSEKAIARLRRRCQMVTEDGVKGWKGSGVGGGWVEGGWGGRYSHSHLTSVHETTMDS